MDADTETMVARAKLFASPTRVEIWCALGELGMYPLDIASTFNLAPSSVSYHLRILYEAGLIEFEQQGRNRLYKWSAVRVAILTEDELNSAMPS